MFSFDPPENIRKGFLMFSGGSKRNIRKKRVNKRFAVPSDVGKRRIIQLPKNFWRTRYWYLKKYKVDPQILSADQMPLHRNKSNLRKHSILKVESSLALLRKTVTYHVNHAPSSELYDRQKNSNRLH